MSYKGHCTREPFFHRQIYRQFSLLVIVTQYFSISHLCVCVNARILIYQIELF